MAGSGTALVAAGRPELATGFANRGAIVEARLRATPSPAEPRPIAMAGIAAVPALPIAWTALAAEARRRGAVGEARGYLGIADRWTRRDTATQDMAYRDAVSRGDMAAAMRHADPLLRRGRMRSALFADIGTRLSDPATAAAFAVLLARAPGWRADYFATAANTTPAVGIDALLVRLHRLESPLIRAEAQPLLAGLIARGQATTAFEIWRRYLAPSATTGALPWPDAAARAAPTPFDWRFTREAEPFVTIDGDRLTIEGGTTGGSIDVAIQTLVPAPGRYRMAADAAMPADRWRWSLACNGQVLVSSRPITEGDITVPAGCGNTVLKLTLWGGSDAASIERVRLAPVR
ncbi:hypothetical protein ACWGK7_18945 (plasmid) [Sphingomonas aurantiaca]